ncbi:hypothetical protein LJC00_00135 [Dysgonomonas sp. OttesenSCG-928-M03]|nr:hypothetical protein [Dysgonomonas sp. OttesenSCG-928-M03]
MNEVLEKIRKPSIFILLLILNLRFLFTVVFNDRQEILSVLTVVFFLLSLDYSGIRREYLYWIILFIAISVVDFTPYKLNILTPLILMQCLSRFNIRIYLQYNIIILGGTAILMFLAFGTGGLYKGTGIDFIRIRHDLGYGHPNAAALYYWGLFISVILSCYLSRYKKLLGYFLAILLVASIYLYSETISRSFIISVIVFTLVIAYYYIRSRSRKNYVIGYSRYIIYALPLLLTVLTIYFGLNAGSYPKLDLLFSLRLSLYKEFLNSLTPIQFLLGTTVFDRIIVDNSYLHLLFEAGIFLFIYFIWLYYFAIKNIIRQQNHIVIAIFVSSLIYGLMESLLLFSVIIGNNLFWVLLYRYRQGEDEEFEPDRKNID